MQLLFCFHQHDISNSIGPGLHHDHLTEELHVGSQEVGKGPDFGGVLVEVAGLGLQNRLVTLPKTNSNSP